MQVGMKNCYFRYSHISLTVEYGVLSRNFDRGVCRQLLNFMRRNPFTAVDGHAETRRISELSHD